MYIYNIKFTLQYYLLLYLAISIPYLLYGIFTLRTCLPVVYGYNELCNTPINPPSEYYYSRRARYSSNLMYCGIIFFPPKYWKKTIIIM